MVFRCLVQASPVIVFTSMEQITLRCAIMRARSSGMSFGVSTSGCWIRSIPARIESLLACRAALPALTPREVTVLELIGKGLRNKEIAVALNIGEETAKQHVKRILSKLEVTDRTAAINVALRRGIIHIN